jgi:hypothetical protein
MARRRLEENGQPEVVAGARRNEGWMARMASRVYEVDYAAGGDNRMTGSAGMSVLGCQMSCRREEARSTFGCRSREAGDVQGLCHTRHKWLGVWLHGLLQPLWSPIPLAAKLCDLFTPCIQLDADRSFALPGRDDIGLGLTAPKWHRHIQTEPHFRSNSPRDPLPHCRAARKDFRDLGGGPVSHHHVT